ncbi:hypothetical protein NQ318_013793 [Aromia moschata]|uniref:Endoplasmic reticulum lectin 1 n=1 Tax=Aromia moschata TaxID=1265417 RepID=A0AAV8Z8E0_9CUCU|nr:hypothetical protein NQ318_013793 [Aromia moschata]
MILFEGVLILCLACRSIQSDTQGFDDTILYSLEWPGQPSPEWTDLEGESVLITSSHQEKYKCYLPSVLPGKKDGDQESKYEGPSPLELILPLFTQTTCSFRLETYWTYEVCHGRYIRQYHEDREGKKTKVQEYILGKWDEKYFERLLAADKENPLDETAEIPMKKIDNMNLPYYEVTMENGTLCDLNNNKPRMTKVLYMCYIHGKHEVYSLKETSTCVYEAVILSPLLCAHPKYQPKDSGEHKINCVPQEGSPDKPYSYLKLRADSAKLRKSSDLDRFRVELVQLDKDESITATKPPETKLLDTSPVESFLLGKNCLNGGTGWWKFEFCYGKSIEQYHMEKGEKKTSINLGRFDKKKHLEWIEEHPHKRPKPVGQRKQLSHFYSGGTVCDKTGKARQTEVKLKCLENPSSPNAVSLYLLEPRYCEYILGVESPLICDILSRADENGLVEVVDGEAEESDGNIPVVNIKL